MHMQGTTHPQFSRALRSTLFGTALATGIAGLSACGAVTSATGSDALSALLPSVTTPKSCNNVAGQLDGVQSALTGTLAPAASQLPVVGGAASAATTALSRALDTVDGLSSAVTTLGQTSNAQAFASQISTVGDSLLCSGSSLSDSVAQLASSTTVPVPGVDKLQSTLAALSQQISAGLAGAPGGNLTSLTGQLTDVSNQLTAIAASLPAQVNQPFLKQILTLNANAFGSMATILQDFGALNATKLSGDITNLLQNTTTGLANAVATQTGLPSSALTQPLGQLQTVTQTLGTTLTTVTAPTFQVISTVLGATGTVTGTVGSFPTLLTGALSTTGAAQSPVQQITQTLAGGTATSSLQALLTQAFGGKLPIIGPLLGG
jgi:hypothetical protein